VRTWSPPSWDQAPDRLAGKEHRKDPSCPNSTSAADDHLRAERNNVKKFSAPGALTYDIDPGSDSRWIAQRSYGIGIWLADT
jgi:hypothetical protein